MSREHPVGEELQDLLDGRVAGPPRAAMEAHLAQCPSCQEELAVLARARTEARRLPPLAQPADLATRISRALDVEDRASSLAAGARPAPSAIPHRWWLVASGLIAAALAALVIRSSTNGDLPTSVARDFAGYREAQLALELQTEDPVALERFFGARGIAFHVRVFDLAMMRYRLIGGRVHRLAGRPTAFFAYAGPDTTPVICEMYEGTLVELPGDAEQRVHNGMTFRIYRMHGMTLVFWQEGAVVCVLASEGATDEVIQLAYAKAAKV